MYKIVEGLVDELKKKGVTFLYNTEIVGFEEQGGELSSLLDQNGRKHHADIFVVITSYSIHYTKLYEDLPEELIERFGIL